jgi:nitrous oxide reductase accessory protein NosL
MKKLFLVALVAATSLASCQKEEVTPAAPQAQTATNDAHVSSSFVATDLTTVMMTLYYSVPPNRPYVHNIVAVKMGFIEKPNSHLRAANFITQTGKVEWELRHLERGRTYYITHSMDGVAKTEYFHMR